VKKRVIKNRSLRFHESELRVVIDQIVNELYIDGPDTQWQASTVERVAEILKDHGVVEEKLE